MDGTTFSTWTVSAITSKLLTGRLEFGGVQHAYELLPSKKEWARPGSIRYAPATQLNNSLKTSISRPLKTVILSPGHIAGCLSTVSAFQTDGLHKKGTSCHLALFCLILLRSGREDQGTRAAEIAYNAVVVYDGGTWEICANIQVEMGVSIDPDNQMVRSQVSGQVEAKQQWMNARQFGPIKVHSRIYLLHTIHHTHLNQGDLCVSTCLRPRYQETLYQRHYVPASDTIIFTQFLMMYTMAMYSWALSVGLSWISS